MTTLTAPAPPGIRRPAVPWARLAWVTWRQHRAGLAGVAALFAGLGLLLLVNGLAMRGSLASLGLNACHPVSAPRCATQLSIFDSDYAIWRNTVPALLQVLPALIGVFTGGPLLARELESGTFRFAWTQGAGRTRWVLAKLILLAVPVTGAAAAFSLLFSWWYQPFLAEGSSLMAPVIFDLSGSVFAAWALAGFAVGAFAGIAIRRIVPAMAAALAGWAGLAVTTALYLRPAYQAPLVARLVRQGQYLIPARSYVTSAWWISPDGRPMSSSAVSSLIQRLERQGLNPKAWVIQHHYGQGITYQPESRFWPFQLIEGGWLLALALVLGAATVWLVRRRAA